MKSNPLKTDASARYDAFIAFPRLPINKEFVNISKMEINLWCVFVCAKYEIGLDIAFNICCEMTYRISQNDLYS